MVYSSVCGIGRQSPRRLNAKYDGNFFLVAFKWRGGKSGLRRAGSPAIYQRDTAKKCRRKESATENIPPLHLSVGIKTAEYKILVPPDRWGGKGEKAV